MKIRHVPLHAEEFLSAVVGEMTPAELGLYWMICLLIYNRGKPIPYDINWLRNKFARSPGLRTLQDTLDRLIESGRVIRDGNELYVSRCLEELELATSRARASRENGARGGRPSNKNNDLKNQGGLQQETLTELNLTEVNKDIEIAKAISPSNVRLRMGDRVFDEDFELWWRAVPRKVGKTAAKAAYAKARRKHGVSADELLDGIRRYADAERGKGTTEQYITHPTSWLNAGRWQDEEGIDNGYARRDVPSDECSITDEEILAALRERKTGVAW